MSWPSLYRQFLCAQKAGTYVSQGTSWNVERQFPLVSGPVQAHSFSCHTLLVCRLGIKREEGWEINVKFKLFMS